MSDFHRETLVRKTRKDHRCDWCHERIEKSTQCIVTEGVFEGDFYRGRYHPECGRASKRYYQTHRCWGEPMPDDPMNRGGIEERGEPETQPLDTP